MTLPDVAYSIRQPWAYFIVHFDKRIENRTRRTRFRGDFLIHASAGMTRAEYDEALFFARRHCGFNGQLPPPEALARGGIVGIARITDCVTQHESPWLTGPFGYVLENVRPLPFVPCKGALNFFKPQPEPVDPLS